ncbi:hypothetical protein V6N12_056392 [Hibiscus sabdariffa]|uniref:Uncharacterized protein n=1 Tax=Hibiscus sabdariffa TaxID=183260 RepID=A0ABR2CSD8_9ROSI
MHVSFLPIKPFPSLALFGSNLKSSKQQQEKQQRREVQNKNKISSALLFLKRSSNKLVKNNTERRRKGEDKGKQSALKRWSQLTGSLVGAVVDHNGSNNRRS